MRARPVNKRFCLRVSGGLLTLGLACVCVALSCQPTAPTTSGEPVAPEPNATAPPWFQDVTDATGLNFVHDPGPTDGSHFLPQIIGSGAAVFDADGDGRLDVLLIQNGGPKGSRNRFYRQQANGTFRDASAGSGLDVAGYGMGVAIGDVDNDGKPDVYLTCYGGDRFFLNQGEGRFVEAKAVGLDNTRWATSAAFFDYDRDGWLDLVVVNYLDLDPGKACHDSGGKQSYCHPNTFAGSVTGLYRNKGRDKAGKWLGFEGTTTAAGLAARPGPGLGVVCADLTGDGWPDIFVANDAKANHLWVNHKNGTFKEEALARGVAYNAQGQAQGNMGVALGDTDGDGLTDLFVTHLVSEYHSLWQQRTRGQFQDRAAAVGLTRGRWRGTGFGTVLADFDHDGALDLAIVNGAVTRALPQKDSYWEPYHERNQLFANDGKGNFRDVSNDNPSFSGWAGVSRGLVVADLDGDGAPDLLVTQIGGPARVYRNVAPNRGHWFVVRALVGTAPCDALGAEVRVRAGGRQWSRLVHSGHSYLCSSDPRAHFGLGATDRVDEITVLWPDGTEEAFPGGGVDRVQVVRQGEGRARPTGKASP